MMAIINLFLIVVIRKLIYKMIGEESLVRKAQFIENKKCGGRIFSVEVGKILKKQTWAHINYRVRKG